MANENSHSRSVPNTVVARAATAGAHGAHGDDGAVQRRPQLVLVARENEAPRMLLSLLEALPDASYPSLEAVQQMLHAPR